MAKNWLYGPKVQRDIGEQPLWVRATTIDIETIADLADLVELRVPGSAVQISVTDRMQTRGRDISREDLAGLDASDRSNLMLTAARPTEATFLNLFISRSSRLAIWVQPIYSAEEPIAASNLLAMEIAEKIANNGTPIFIWRRVLSVLPYVGLLALALAWFSAELVTRMPLPLHLAGWLAVLFAAFVARNISRENNARLASSMTGIYVREESREQTSARRADTRMNIKVAAITALISIPTTVLVTLLTTGL